MKAWLWNLSIWEAAIFFFAVNVILLIGSILLWHAARWTSASPRLFAVVKPITGSDVTLTILALLVNVGVGIFGWWVWRINVLTVPDRPWYIAIIEWIPLLLFMDLGMYLTHRMAHIRMLFLAIHQTHHQHHEVNALSLFVLNPIEVAGFAALLLAGIWLLAPSEWAMVIYVVLNVAFGTIGHAGLLPRFPRLATAMMNRSIGTSLFHGQHHIDREYNFGFYTTVWDRLFGTLHPSYDQICETKDDRASEK